jgi:HAD superfamily hydrolase (TIGR01509 family)
MTLSPGLLFDLDGTLVETDPTHLAAFNDILTANGVPPVDQHYYNTHIIGFQNAEIFARLFPAMGEADHKRLADEKEALFRSRAGGLHPAKGLLAFLDWADAHGVPAAVVTNAPRPNADLMLRALGLVGRFRHVVIGDEMAFPKPHPLPYLTGANLLGVDVAASVAFEDSRSGIRAAVAAGLTTVGMSTSLSPDALREAGAHLAVPDFTDPALLALVRTTTGRG